jgi:hypothetical protein
MSPARHCDEIIRLIDEMLNEVPRTPSGRPRHTDQKATPLDGRPGPFVAR